MKIGLAGHDALEKTARHSVHRLMAAQGALYQWNLPLARMLGIPLIKGIATAVAPLSRPPRGLHACINSGLKKASAVRIVPGQTAEGKRTGAGDRKRQP